MNILKRNRETKRETHRIHEGRFEWNFSLKQLGPAPLWVKRRPGLSQDTIVVCPVGVFSASLDCERGSWQSKAARSRLVTFVFHRRHDGLDYGMNGDRLTSLIYILLRKYVSGVVPV